MASIFLQVKPTLLLNCATKLEWPTLNITLGIAHKHRLRVTLQRPSRDAVLNLRSSGNFQSFLLIDEFSSSWADSRVSKDPRIFSSHNLAHRAEQSSYQGAALMFVSFVGSLYCCSTVEGRGGLDGGAANEYMSLRIVEMRKRRTKWGRTERS